jgi:hypothetical protein
MSQPDIAPIRKRPRSGLAFLGTVIVASGALAAFLIPAVQKARNAARESQLL